MLLVPVRAAARALEVPWVTTTIVAVCTLIQLLASLRGVPEAELERASVEYSAAVKAALSHGERRTFTSEAEQWKALRALRNGEVEGIPAALVDRLKLAHENLREVRRRDPALRLAFAPADRLSLGLVTNTWAHAGWLHLISNMFFLWFIGAHLEVVWGRRLFLALYLGGGLVATCFYWSYHVGAETPLVGASGAIAATLAAFAVCYWSANCRYWYGFVIPGLGVRTGTFRFYPTFLLPMWLVDQFFMARFEGMGWSDGVAYSAHLGGIVAGGALAFGLKFKGLAPMPPTYEEEGEGEVQRRVPTEAEKLIASGEMQLLTGHAERAAEMADALLAKNPFDAAARRLRLKAAMKLGDIESAGRLASEQLGLLRVDHDSAGIVALYREVDAACPAAALTAEALWTAFGACKEAKEETLALSAGRKLVKSFPQHEHVPAALLRIAELHQAAGRAEQARNALLHLVENYPHHALAPQARARLSRA